jgi:hypothetical protein
MERTDTSRSCATRARHTTAPRHHARVDLRSTSRAPAAPGSCSSPLARRQARPPPPERDLAVPDPWLAARHRRPTPGVRPLIASQALGRQQCLAALNCLASPVIRSNPNPDSEPGPHLHGPTTRAADEARTRDPQLGKRKDNRMGKPRERPMRHGCDLHQPITFLISSALRSSAWTYRLFAVAIECPAYFARSARSTPSAARIDSQLARNS